MISLLCVYWMLIEMETEMKRSGLTWKIRKTDGKIVLLHRGRVAGEFVQISDMNSFLQGWFNDDSASINWIKTARR